MYSTGRSEQNLTSHFQFIENISFLLFQLNYYTKTKLLREFILIPIFNSVVFNPTKLNSYKALFEEEEKDAHIPTS